LPRPKRNNLGPVWPSIGRGFFVLGAALACRHSHPSAMARSMPGAKVGSAATGREGRAAVSGLAKLLGSTNFNALLSAIFKDFALSKRHGKTREPSQNRLDVWRD